MAYFITKFSERVQPVLILFTTIPMWINLLLRTYAWIGILSNNGIFKYDFEIVSSAPGVYYVYRSCCKHRSDL